MENTQTSDFLTGKISFPQQQQIVRCHHVTLDDWAENARHEPEALHAVVIGVQELGQTNSRFASTCRCNKTSCYKYSTLPA